MFINRFWDYVGEEVDEDYILFIIGGVLLMVAIVGIIFYFLPLSLKIWSIALMIVLGEWAYIDWAKNNKNLTDFGLAKFGYLMGSAPFVILSIGLIHFRNNVLNFLNIPEVRSLVIGTFILSGAAAIIYLYFQFNIKTAKAINKKYHPKKKKKDKK